MAATDKTITLERVLSGDTVYPMSLEDLERFMREETKDVGCLHFTLALAEFKKLYAYYETRIPGANGPQSTPMATVASIALPDSPGSSGSTPHLSETKKALLARLQHVGMVVSPSELARIMNREDMARWAQMEALEIYALYVKEDAPESIVIQAGVRKKLSDALFHRHDYHPTSFNEAIDVCYKHMTSQTMSKFRKFAVTNIGDYEAFRRLLGMYILVFIVLVVTSLMIFFKLNNFIRLITFPAIFYACVGFNQWRLHFCVTLGTNLLFHS